MRAKQLKLIITFYTTTAAMHMEKVCLQNQLPGRLIPVPTTITSNCGMSWCAPLDAKSDIEQSIAKNGIEVEGWYEVLV